MSATSAACDSCSCSDPSLQLSTIRSREIRRFFTTKTQRNAIKGEDRLHSCSLFLRAFVSLWLASSIRRYAMEKSTGMSATCVICSCSDPKYLFGMNDRAFQDGNPHSGPPLRASASPRDLLHVCILNAAAASNQMKNHSRAHTGISWFTRRRGGAEGEGMSLLTIRCKPSLKAAAPKLINIPTGRFRRRRYVRIGA